MSTPAGFLLVLLDALRSSLRGRRAFFLLLVTLFPAGLAVLLRGVAGDDVDASDFLELVALVVLQFVVPFCGLLLGVGALGDEIDARTITYLFTRPLPRWVFLLGRVLGFSLGFGAVLALGTLALVAVCAPVLSFGAAEVAGTVAIAVGGLAAYIAFFALLRTMFRRALFIGFLVAFVSEVMISKMPVTLLSRLSLWHHLALLQVRLQDSPASAIRRIAPGIAPEEAPATSIAVVAAVCAVSLLVGCLVVHTREVRVPAAVAQ